MREEAECVVDRPPIPEPNWSQVWDKVDGRIFNRLAIKSESNVRGDGGFDRFGREVGQLGHAMLSRRP